MKAVVIVSLLPVKLSCIAWWYFLITGTCVMFRSAERIFRSGEHIFRSGEHIFRSAEYKSNKVYSYIKTVVYLFMLTTFRLIIKTGWLVNPLFIILVYSTCHCSLWRLTRYCTKTANVITSKQQMLLHLNRNCFCVAIVIKVIMNYAKIVLFFSINLKNWLIKERNGLFACHFQWKLIILQCIKTNM